MLRGAKSLLLVSAALVAAAAAAEEAPRLFELVPGEAPAGRGIGAAWRVAVDGDLLLAGADRVRLDLPDGLVLTAVRRRLERRGPGSALWQGRLGDGDRGDVVFTLHHGVLSGYITSAFGEYEIRQLEDGDYRVARLESDRLPSCGVGDPALDALQSAQAEDAAPARPSPVVAGDSAGSIDIVVLFTPQVRQELGSADAAVARIQLLVDTANVAFAHSHMAARLHLVHAEQSNFQEEADSISNLIALQESAQAAGLREAYNADLMALVVAYVTDYCGIAQLMTFLDPAHFSTIPFSMTDIDCIQSFGHEVGHNLGFNHDPDNAPTQEYLWVFPWAFGHYESDNFRTMMAYPNPCGYCEQILNFSNPRIDYNGLPTGIVDHRDNARVGQVTAPLVANYRRSGRSFDDDFEDGDTAGWTVNRGPMVLRQPGLGGSDFALEVPLLGTATRRFLKHRVAPPGDGLDVELTLNLTDVDLGSAEVPILSLLGRGQRHTELRLRQIDGGHWLILYTKADQGGFQEVARTSLRAAVDERVRLEFRRSTSPEVADGFVRLIKNGGNRGAFRDFDNDTWPVREVRLGAPFGSPEAPPGGTFLVDDYTAVNPEDG
jgi:peptidyl-Asp metalloendopeptidase